MVRDAVATIRKGNVPMDILLVEDSYGDVRMTMDAFRDANPSVRLHVAKDGHEAMAFLRRVGAKAQAPRPELILLDLKVPKIDGLELLALIKGDESLRMIPTVILTTSDAESDIVESFKRQANSYLCKPIELAAFESLVKSINDFWVTKSRLPPQVQESALAHTDF
jgi:two-component system, chemotaxis family, response regulator Rcp1